MPALYAVAKDLWFVTPALCAVAKDLWFVAPALCAVAKDLWFVTPALYAITKDLWVIAKDLCAVTKPFCDPVKQRYFALPIGVAAAGFGPVNAPAGQFFLQPPNSL